MTGVIGSFSTAMTVVSGAIMAVLGALLAAGPQPYSDGEVVAATVVAVEHERSGGRVRYHAVLEFEFDGAVQRVTDERSRPFAPSVGAVVQVSFPRAEPARARSLHQPGTTRIVAIAVVVVGAAVVIAGGVAGRRRRADPVPGRASTPRRRELRSDD